ncbi:12330_t:CDS:2, partial [Gigaspora rosea]
QSAYYSFKTTKPIQKEDQSRKIKAKILAWMLIRVLIEALKLDEILPISSQQAFFNTINSCSHAIEIFCASEAWLVSRGLKFSILAISLALSLVLILERHMESVDRAKNSMLSEKLNDVSWT